MKWVVPGGDSGQDSIRMGLEALRGEIGEDDIVMIHDGNRCMVSDEILSDSLATFKKYGSAVAAIPCVEAVFRSADDGLSSIDSIPREQLYRTQTPHTYTYGKLMWAHKEAKKSYKWNRR